MMKFKLLVYCKNVLGGTWRFYSEHNEEEKTMDDFEVDTLEEAKVKVQDLIGKSYYKKNEIKIVQVYDFEIKVS